MATYVIGDVHGCGRQLDEMLSRLSPGTGDEVWLLGDLCDRGPDSAKLLKWATDGPSGFRFLLGNHEDMALEILARDPREMGMRMDDPWSYNGGDETAEDLYENSDPDWRENVLVPWLRELPPFANVPVGNRTVTLVHAGFAPAAWDRSAKRGFPDGVWGQNNHTATKRVGNGWGLQHEQDMLWIREDWLLYRGELPNEVVFGHTPTILLDDGPRETTRIWHDRIRHDIDCGCAYGGKLAAMRLDDMEEFYVPGLDV